MEFTNLKKKTKKVDSERPEATLFELVVKKRIVIYFDSNLNDSVLK